MYSSYINAPPQLVHPDMFRPRHSKSRSSNAWLGLLLVVVLVYYIVVRSSILNPSRCGFISDDPDSVVDPSTESFEPVQKVPHPSSADGSIQGAPFGGSDGSGGSDGTDRTASSTPSMLCSKRCCDPEKYPKDYLGYPETTCSNGCGVSGGCVCLRKSNQVR